MQKNNGSSVKSEQLSMISLRRAVSNEQPVVSSELLSRHNKNRLRFTVHGSLLMVLTVCCLLLTSCYEPNEGCLDATSTNFDANADDACPDCCTYPTLEVSFLHKVATSDSTTANLAYNSFYTFDSIDFFLINRIRFYISDIQLLHTDGSFYTGLDSIDLAIPEETGDTSEIRVPNNFILVDKNNFQDNSLGNFRKSGNFDGIQFKIGITDPANHADPNQLSDEHPLSFQEESMHWNTNDGYIFNQISLTRDTLTRDSILVEYGTDDKLRTVSLNESFFVPEGFNITLVLQINYLQWFEGINLETESTTMIAETIVDRVAASISLVEVKLE